jgi:hypothetical protein
VGPKASLAGQLRHIWISDHCALVNLVPYCFIKFGHKEERGDLFKNMRQYLDQRLTDPLP